MESTQKIKTKFNEIWIDEEGFLILKLDSNTEMDLKETKACFEAYKKLGIGPQNKVLELIDARGDGTMTSEARSYVAKVGKDYFIASAIIGNSLAVRLIVNFYISFHTRDVPFKMFATEEAARAWLRTFR